MTDFHKLVTTRRSIRAFKNDEIEPEKISDIFRAALMSPSAKALQPWHLKCLLKNFLKQKKIIFVL